MKRQAICNFILRNILESRFINFVSFDTKKLGNVWFCQCSQSEERLCLNLVEPPATNVYWNKIHSTSTVHTERDRIDLNINRNYYKVCITLNEQQVYQQWRTKTLLRINQSYYGFNIIRMLKMVKTYLAK